MSNGLVRRNLLPLGLRPLGRLLSRRCLGPLAAAALAVLATPTAHGQIKPEDVPPKLVASAGEGLDTGPHMEDIKDAVTKFRESNFVEARNLLREAKKKTPKLAPAEIMMVKLLAFFGQQQAARSELELCAVENPSDPEAFTALGEIALSEGQLAEATLLLDHARKLATDFNENPFRQKNLLQRSYAGLSQAEESLVNANKDRAAEHWAKSRAYMEQFLKLDANDAGAHARLGRAMFNTKNTKDAYAELQKAEELENKKAKEEKRDPQLLPANIVIAQLYLQAGDKEKAKKFIDAAMQSEPNTMSGQLALAQYLIAARDEKDPTNDYKAALEHAQKALKAKPDSVDAMLAVALVARLMQDYDVAVKVLEKAHVDSPGNSAVTNQLALSLIELSQERAAERAFEFAAVNFKANSDNPEAAATFGYVCYKVGRTQEADRAFAALVRPGVKITPDWAFYLARFLAEQGRDRDALRYVNSALEPKQPFAYEKEARNLQLQLKGKVGSG